jgi:mannose-6-phosphate isomerase-like protein (cupin superfamily)
VVDEDPRAAGPPPELGARIRAARVDAGVSVRGLARQVGVSASLLSQVERGLGADDPPTSHLGREYGYVIGGRLQIEVGDEVVELGPGDAVAFGSETPHRFRALGGEPVTAVWLNVRARV